MRSMTGFGQCETTTDNIKIDVIIKSVNGKFLDIDIKGPKLILAAEDEIKKIISKNVSRGTITMFVNISKQNSSSLDVSLDEDLAKQVLDKTNYLASLLKLEANMNAKDLIRFNGVLTTTEAELDSAIVLNLLKETTLKALIPFVSSREVEGNNLKQDLKQKIDLLQEEVFFIKQFAPQVQKDYYEKLKTRVEELIGEKIEDESKIITEVAFFADKADINEELTRLESHISQFNNYLQEEMPVGKKLEFLSQEITREINTMGSKANNIEITKRVLNAKNINESIKEQIRNVE